MPTVHATHGHRSAAARPGIAVLPVRIGDMPTILPGAAAMRSTRTTQHTAPQRSTMQHSCITFHRYAPLHRSTKIMQRRCTTFPRITLYNCQRFTKSTLHNVLPRSCSTVVTRSIRITLHSCTTFYQDHAAQLQHVHEYNAAQLQTHSIRISGRYHRRYC